MNLEKFRLSGKSALITGAAGLLGYQHAEALLEIDAKVVLTDISESSLQAVHSKLAKKYAANLIRSEVMDVSVRASIQATSDKLRTDGCRVDILINNAAIDPKVKGTAGIGDASRLEYFSIDQWNLEMSVGLTGAFQCSQVFGSAMAEDGRGGVIINIASDLSVCSPDQRLYRKPGIEENLQPVKPVTYSVIKAGLVGLTRYLATYWAHQGVRSNALSPGGVYVDQGEDFVQRLANLIPLGRMAHQDEYRSAIQFLCSDASSYMNGQNIVMDGGRSVW
jgi:NAD(P)-dependent dehydrogenase (short-subunit alcohol dehydrogenase family)